MTDEQGSLAAGAPTSSPGTGLNSGQPLGLCLAGLGWSLLLVAGIWILPLVTVSTGQAGLQPREKLAATGEPLGITLFSTGAALAVIITVLVAASQRGGQRRRTLATTAFVFAIVLAALAAVAAVTILLGLYVLPGAGLLVGATNQARHR